MFRKVTKAVSSIGELVIGVITCDVQSTKIPQSNQRYDRPTYLTQNDLFTIANQISWHKEVTS